ncbi:lysoplasmalogenase [Tenacibaculum xiamenense]|uniref:lysoplasmalogenase n=1 Tax=Tenacibaculum xiamenense TaxID=1261553 RepID=UPI0038B579C7
MQTKVILSHLLFLIVGIIDVYAVIIENRSLELVFKPFLMITLLIVYFSGVNKPNSWFIASYFFSFWGNVFLIYEKSHLIYGLIAFLIVHIIYIKLIVGFLKKDSVSRVIVLSLPFSLLFLGVMYFLFNNLGNMVFPVMLYGVVIAVFGIMSLLNYLQERKEENLWLLFGSILFIFSNIFVGFDNFYDPYHSFNVLLIALFIVAQYCICRAMILKGR